ncbi:MAG: [pyruvate, water dikinase]-phosphate phosphotransferase / [pyruvate, water dikinase] kinase [Desulfuromonadales bacterium]|jgi:regulator of PEP synthase PpsR (kinase-PPPase family)|nr:[pyruvate, water dikinase]-phosphate phosphotransferase / [pyruvate, water dikinase] kinase [Desulfuromonadales bacterium]
MTTPQIIYVMSDATGETAEKIVNAVLTQFRDKPVRLRRISNVRNKAAVLRGLEEIQRHKGMVVYTVVNRDLAQFVQDESETRGIMAFDLVTPLLSQFSKFFGRTPGQEPGLLHDMDEEYFRRIEAVEFTVKHDDGQEVHHLVHADIVLVGVSRTSKTPLSTYLAHLGWKVANVPLVLGIDPPRELFQVDSKRIVGLYIDPQRLVELRLARLRHLGQDPRAAYADIEEIEEELRYAKVLFRRHGWVTVNVSGKAVEETANEVLVKMNLK